MFRGMIDEAKAAANELIARVATRVAIGVVFLVAIGFAVAALTMQLVARYGAINASWMIAAAFAVLGLIGLIAAKVHDSRQDVRKVEEEQKAEAAAPTMAEATTTAAMQLPLALVGSLLTTTGGFISPLTVLRFLARNKALVAFGGILAVLLWPQPHAGGDAAHDAVAEPAE